MSSNAKQASLVETPSGTTSEQQAQALALRESGLSKTVVDAGMLPMIERLAAMPDFDVAKLEKLIDMQERILDRNAEAAFNVAFVAMQADIPTIIERASTDKGKYAPREDIVDAVRPILKRHGFTLAFRTEWPDGKIKVIGILTHSDGHARESEFLTGPDTSGSKNATQALGSAVEYGRRYTTTDLLNIVTRGADDDGHRSGHADAPAGFEAFWAVLEGLAGDGIAALTSAFNKGSADLKNYTVSQRRQEWAALKAQAQQAGRRT